MSPSPAARARHLRHLAGVAAALLASSALGLSCGGDTPAGGPDGGGPAGASDAGCLVTLGGLLPYSNDGGLLLDDAGFACLALLLRDDAGLRTSLSLTPVGALPPGVEAFNAVVIFDGGAPPPQDAGPDAGPDGGVDAGPQFNLASPLVLQASASALVTDTGSTVAFAVQKPPATSGTLGLTFTSVPDAGLAAGGGTVLGAHGVLDATLPYLYGPRNDGGPVDAGYTVNVHATF